MESGIFLSLGSLDNAAPVAFIVSYLVAGVEQLGEVFGKLNAWL
jgi:hypothetical protein